jgi:hypothetical protein
MATLVYGSVNTMTITGLNSNTSSPTAAWASAVVDNTSTIYIDALVQVVLDMANTAAANDKAIYVYAYGGIESGVYSNPISGSEGDVTLANVTANGQNIRLIGVMPYTTTDEVIESSPMSVANAFGGVLPPFWGVVILDYSGAAIAGGGNSVKWRGVTVA